MPVIELLGNPGDHGWITAIMLFPTDDQMRTLYMTRLEFGRQLDGVGSDSVLEVSAASLRNLMDAPSRLEMSDFASNATKKAIYCGDILSTLYLMNMFSEDAPSLAHPSMGKAIHITKEFSVRNKFGDGAQMHYSESKIRVSWNEYKDVAHLWAAYRLTQAYPLANTSDIRRAGFANPDFLGVAQTLYEFGTKFVPEGSHDQLPVLAPVSTWQLPKSVIPVRLASSQVPEGLVELIRNYKA